MRAISIGVLSADVSADVFAGLSAIALAKAGLSGCRCRYPLSRLPAPQARVREKSEG